MPRRRSPSWGAWIEMFDSFAVKALAAKSLPLVGSVD